MTLDGLPIRLGQCTMHLNDGRVIVLTGLTINDVCDTMNALQITPQDVVEVVNVVDLHAKPLVH